jgi:hypothetical protein
MGGELAEAVPCLSGLRRSKPPTLGEEVKATMMVVDAEVGGYESLPCRHHRRSEEEVRAADTLAPAAVWASG